MTGNRPIFRHALVVGIVVLQPPGNLLGRPVQHQFTRNEAAQLAVHGKQTSLRAQGRNPCLVIRIMGTVGRTATMARNFPAYRRRSSIEATGDLTNRRTRSDPSRDIFSLSESEC